MDEGASILALRTARPAIVRCFKGERQVAPEMNVRQSKSGIGLAQVGGEDGDGSSAACKMQGRPMNRNWVGV